MKNITMADMKRISAGRCLDDDLILFKSIAEVPVSEETWKLKCLFVGLCTKGSARYTVDTEEFILHPGDALIIGDDHVIDNYEPSSDFDGKAFAMSYRFYYEIIKNIHRLSSLLLFSCNHPIFALTDDEIETVYNYFDIMNAKLMQKEHRFRRDLLGSLINTMICDLSNAMYRIQQQEVNSVATSADVIFTKFIRLVEKYYKKERMVLWYAGQLGISPKYLAETVRRTSKRTPNEWIDKYVILEVRLMLKNSSMSIKEIADELNFPSQSSLGKYFKERMGISPSQYRKK